MVRPVFGMGFGELTVVVIVALVIFGPKELPKILRKLGKWSGKMRRMAADLRAQSGIDDALRDEGLAEPIHEIRKLARVDLGGMVRSASVGAAAAATTSRSEPLAPEPMHDPEMYVERDRENPREGPDSYGALPDTAIVYTGTLPKSPLADDPLYMTGDESAVLPPAAATSQSAEHPAE